MRSSVPGEAQLHEKLLPREREVIARRRAFWGLPAAHAPDGPAGAQGGGIVRGPVGVALSGGGIRSATFCLGVLQVFAKRGLLKWVDYLSTVSGGGYIGSCLSTILHYEDSGQERPARSLIHHGGQPESPVLQYLRSGGNYLAPDGLLDVLRIPAVLLRGILLNFLALIPFTGVVALLNAWQYPNLADLDASVDFFRPDGAELVFLRWAPWVVGAFGLWILLFPIVSAIVPYAGYRVRSAYERTFALLLLLAVCVPVIELGPWLYHLFAHFEATDLDNLSGALSASLTGLVLASRSLDRSMQQRAAPAPGKSADQGLVRAAADKLRLACIGFLGPGSLLLVFFVMLHWLYGEPVYELTPAYEQGLRERMLQLAGALLAVYAFTRVFINMNQTGMHSFYRDRLSAAYLFNPRDLAQEDAIKLSELSPEKDGSPYRLINATLNVPGTRDRNLKGRAGDFFLFSPEFCGSFLTGYAPTRQLEDTDRHLNLGTAFAISGAAASPYMGPHTPRLLVFLLTLLNVRLDYWIPNPLRSRGWTLARILRGCRVGPSYLIAELLGWLDARSRYVNLSDGGHIENLGLYELLRRRCRFILCCDAEEDPGLNLPSLGQLTAYARMDDGVWISWTNLSLLRKGEDGYSQAQWFYGTIDYGEADGTGQILYIKSSLSGREPEDVASYHAQHPDFPQQSMLDQFFDELQFEAYRALGYFIANQLFDAGADDVNDIEEWFEARRKDAQQALVQAAAMRSALEVA